MNAGFSANARGFALVVLNGWLRRCWAFRPFVHGPVDPPPSDSLSSWARPCRHLSSNPLPVVLEEGIRSLIGAPKVDVVDGELILGAAWQMFEEHEEDMELVSHLRGVQDLSTRELKSIIEMTVRSLTVRPRPVRFRRQLFSSTPAPVKSASRRAFGGMPKNASMARPASARVVAPFATLKGVVESTAQELTGKQVGSLGDA